jgi:DNA invertase Pin-like site-specific DNA recombinase
MTMTTNNGTVYGLARASTKKQVDSMAVQADKIRATCAALGFGVPNVLEEPLGTSGRKTDFAERPKGKWLLENAKRGDTIILTAVDRVGRDAADILSTIKVFRKRGVRLIILNIVGGDQYILDMGCPWTATTVGIMAVIAQSEGMMIGTRTKGGMGWMKANGYRVSYGPGLGRKFVDTGEKRPDGRARLKTEWDQGQLQIIELIVKLRESGRKWSWEEIATLLLDRGLRDETGCVWGAANPKKGKLIGDPAKPRTKKVRRAYRWWKQMEKEGRLPAVK